MSNTTTIQPSSVESIPLQPITGRTGISDVNEDVQAEVSTSEPQQTSSELQDEAQSASDPASAETDSGADERQPTNSTSAVEKWPLCLNAAQVLIGVLAFAGFLAMVYPQIIDHFINKDSLKLSEWTAWMTFRDECRALLNEGRDIGEDCKDVLHQPLPRPPIPVDGNIRRHEANITHGIHTTSGITIMQKRSTVLRLGGFLVRGPAWLAAAFLLPLVLSSWYRKLYRSSQQQSIRRIELYRTWVTDEVARLQPYKSIGYTTGQDTITWLKTLRKRTKVQEYTSTEIQHNENQTTIRFDQIPEAITILDLTDASPPPLSLVKVWDSTTQNALEDENTEAEEKGTWLPVVNIFEDENTKAEDEGPWLPVFNNDGNTEAETEGPWLPVVNNSGDQEGRTIATKYLHTVELILDKLGVLGYHNFAFDHIEGRANLREYLGAAHQRGSPCDYTGCPLSPSWHENMGTSCSIFPVHFLDYLNDNSGHWLIRIPEFSLDTATVCLAEKLPFMAPGTWRYWQPDELIKGLNDSQDEPCLYVMSIGKRHVRLLFENITRQQHTTIMNGLIRDEQHQWRDCCRLHIPTREVKLHFGIIEHVFFAANEGSLDTYTQKCTKCEWCPMIEGSYTTYEPDDSETGSQMSTDETTSWSDITESYERQELESEEEKMSMVKRKYENLERQMIEFESEEEKMSKKRKRKDERRKRLKEQGKRVVSLSYLLNTK